MRGRWICLWLIAAALVTSACLGKSQPEVEETVQAVSLSTLQTRTFEALWALVNENYVYEDFHGVDWQAVHEEYLAKVEAGLSADEFAEAMRAMLAKLPPGAAQWQTRAERIEQEMMDPTSYEGIGAYVAVRGEPEPRVILLSVMPDSPAEQAGLEAHDSILAIDGEPVRAEEGLDVIERVRGPAGSQVTLRVRSPGESPRDVVVTRGRVVASDTLRVALVSDENDIGYFLFPAAPYADLANDVARSLRELSDHSELKGLILDLRVATVGSGWPLAPMMALFANGYLGDMYTRADVRPLVVEGQNLGGSQELPLAILVGPDTEDSPEVFAAALQSVGRAIIVGMPTPGHVEGMSEYPLPDGSRVFLATSSYRTPDGREIGLTGVQPDIRVEADWDEVTFDRDPVRDAAIEALKSAG